MNVIMFILQLIVVAIVAVLFTMRVAIPIQEMVTRLMVPKLGLPGLTLMFLSWSFLPSSSVESVPVPQTGENDIASLADQSVQSSVGFLAPWMFWGGVALVAAAFIIRIAKDLRSKTRR